jgi:hypothetical protein
MPALMFIGAAFLLAVSVAGLVIWYEFPSGRDQSIIIAELGDHAGGPLKISSSARSAALALIPPAHTSATHGSALPPSAISSTARLPMVNLRPIRLAPVSLGASTAAARSSSDYPLFIARSTKPSDPALADWLDRWQNNLASGRSLSPDDGNRLQEILAETPLKCVPLFQIGRSFQEISRDSAATAIFYEAAVSRANRELLDYTPSSAEAKPIINALSAAKPLLWDVVDGGGDKRFVDTLYALNKDLAQWISPEDKALSNARIHGEIGMAECLFLNGKIRDSISVAEGIPTSGLTQDQLASTAWIHGLALYAAGRYDPAILQFRIVDGDPSFKYWTEGGRMIVMSLAKKGDLPAANAALDDFIRRHRPEPRQIVPLLATIEGKPVLY